MMTTIDIQDEKDWHYLAEGKLHVVLAYKVRDMCLFNISPAAVVLSSLA